MDFNAEPQLAPPGAGLPFPELMVAKLIFKCRLQLGSRASFSASFQSERRKIQELVKTCEESKGAEPILIPRLTGMEDSSRHWSVWMTLEHLRMVHDSITKVITALTSGVAMEGAASTASVKPRKEVTARVLRHYETSCDGLQKAVDDAPDLNTKLKFTHPWFGPLNAAGWHAMAGQHLGIHRRQIEQILKRLEA
ncbi:DinB family protein [Prosthecobacter fusiformis]|uniref:DinB family protein n=1 Tax=Prosthecobacter fusiformis TaxID=48464 RepID=A0A4R7SPS5_9BACT|nr:DinB family protein [Prosthecobacter fusiformis]